MKTDKLFLLGERAAAGRVRGIFALALAVLLSAPRAALAKSPGTTAFNFLNIGAGARQMAMANNAVSGQLHTGRWTDVGTLERLDALRRELAGNEMSPR